MHAWMVDIWEKPSKLNQEGTNQTHILH